MSNKPTSEGAIEARASGGESVMEVRKWTERQTDKVWELCQHSDRDICPACVADAFAPTITKLVQALQDIAKYDTFSGDHAKAALAELEKP